MMAKQDLSVDDHLRKAKWHLDHPKVGNRNLADSHIQSGLLKVQLKNQERDKRNNFAFNPGGGTGG